MAGCRSFLLSMLFSLIFQKNAGGTERNRDHNPRQASLQKNELREIEPQKLASIPFSGQLLAFGVILALTELANGDETRENKTHVGEKEEKDEMEQLHKLFPRVLGDLKQFSEFQRMRREGWTPDQMFCNNASGTFSMSNEKLEKINRSC